MTLDEFNLLSDPDKISTALQGNFVDVRFEAQLKVALYSHPEFYTEVCYDRTGNRIVKCRAFTSLSHLAAYISLN